jgi:hypothetical protein
MANEKQNPEIFPSDPSKTYGLMELARGSSPLVAKEPEDTVMTFPNLVIIEVVTALAVLVLLLFLSAVRDAPLEEFANPDMSPNPAKAAWYLIAVQELILHIHPTFGSIILPGFVVLALAAVPYLDRSQKGLGHWFTSPRGKRIAMFTALCTLLVVPTLVLLDSHIGDTPVVWRQWLPTATPVWVTGIVIPLSVILVLLGILYFVLRRIRTTTREMMIAFFTVFVVTYIILTIIPLVFRGPYMHIYWPGRWPEVH